MAAALVLPTTPLVGSQLVVKGTGFALSHEYTLTITGGGPGSFSVELEALTDGAGAFDLSDVLTITLNAPGNVFISVNDGTSTVNQTVQVWTEA